MISVLFFSIFFLFVSPHEVSAYLDPGTGSYVTQLLIGFTLGGLYMIKIFWHRITTGIKKFHTSHFKKNAKKSKENN